MATAADAGTRSRPMTGEERKVILASSAGTIFEWYDFYLYATLASVIGQHFFSPSIPESTRTVFTLLVFAAGFIVRPFGALVFGSLGDVIGRKYTFLMTILIMGASTFLVGCLPTYERIGLAAPLLLIALRVLQGLALGGEYGGAAVYVAEHAPAGNRGRFTSWIQTTATIGLFVSLIVIMLTRNYLNGAFPSVEFIQAGVTVMNPDGTPKMLTAFDSWGWRIPFLISILLLGISLYIRLTMEESPAFKKMKAEGSASKAPLREAFGNWKNGKIALIALFGLTAGQAVVWYSGQFYALLFLKNIKVDAQTADILVAWSLIFGTAGFVFFGTLSDRIGRKPIILAGCLLAAVTYFPVFNLITSVANPVLHAAHQQSVTVTVDPNDCSFQFNPTGTSKFTTSCDIATSFLAKSTVNYSKVDGAAGALATVKIGETEVASFDGAANAADITAAKAKVDEAKAGIDAALIKAVTDAELALSQTTAAAGNADKAVKAAADDAAKATAQTALDAANAAVAAAQTALDAARAAVPADKLAGYDAAQADLAKANGVKGAFEKGVNEALKAVGYPIAGVDNPSIAKAAGFFGVFTGQNFELVLILTYLIVLVTMVYGPIAAMLVELYPTRIRYSGLSLPYHIGNGWFGGLLPATAFAISAQTGNLYSGLWYAIVVAAVTVVIGTLLVPNGTHKKDIFADDAK